MYCKHCGKEITSDSKFCSHCGKSQDTTNNTLTNKPIWIIYLIWAVANLCLLMGNKDYQAADHFFPFRFDYCHPNNDGYRYIEDYYTEWNKEYYDFSEFITYVFLLPLICYVINKVYRKHSDKIDNIIRKLLKK